MGKRTVLFDRHQALGARMVDFGGWELPLHYGSQVEEHHQVRRDCGVFDVSHMAVVDVRGAAADSWLRGLLANDVARLERDGQALYSVMLNEHGGVIDDLIVWRMAQGYRLVLNAACRDKDLAWLHAHSGVQGLSIEPRDDLAMLAVQGPQARVRCAELFGTARAALVRELESFQGQVDGEWFLSRTGYTGEDGLEIMLPAAQAAELFGDLVAAGVAPIGLGARDTLRLEAGLDLYGQEMDENTSPLTANLGWTVAWEPDSRDFVGRAALRAQQGQSLPRLVGLVLEERGVLRARQAVRVEGGSGEITSGSYSPTLNKAIALARLPAGVGERAEVEIRGRWYPVRVVSPRFVRHGRVLI